MKFCAIGCGGYASDVHGPSQQKIATDNRDVELSACCDLDETRARTYQERFGFSRHYRDIGRMLECERPDAVSLIVPPHATCSLAIPLLKKGIPLFIEKPPGVNLAELEEMISASRQGKGSNQVAFNRRYMSVMRQAREILEAEFFPSAFLQINYNMIRNDRRDPDFSTTAIHAIDAVSYLAGSPYREVAINYRELAELGKGIAEFTLEGDCENGTRFRINVQPMAGITEERCILHGVGRTMKVDLLGREKNQFLGSLEYWKGDRLHLHDQARGDLLERNGTYTETLAFLEAVRRGKRPNPTLEECRQQMMLMEALRTRRKHLFFNHEGFDANAEGIGSAASPKELLHVHRPLRTQDGRRFHGIPDGE